MNDQTDDLDYEADDEILTSTRFDEDLEVAANGERRIPYTYYYYCPPG